MPKLRGPILLVTILFSFAAGGLAGAQTTPPLDSAQRTTSYDRLFLDFAKDAAVANRQWWEGQVELLNGDDVDTRLIRGVVAFQPWRDVELGGSVGFGSTNASGGLPDGQGATDLDAWGKYYLGTDPKDTEFAVGGVLTLPTGDDTAGLGQDAFGLTGFGSLRYRTPQVIVTVNAGLQFNDDGKTQLGATLDGKTAAQVGAGVIYPFSDQASLVGELRFHGKRFDGTENDMRILAGVNWRAFNRGVLRGALGIGLSDGAPDVQILGAYAVVF